ncbi:MAG: hypothetical protein SP1CHLAM54_01260 [Chlamydiia bacterium]|nr:hypothetical protein [Chlamydiia bacterium]MCH9615047.1 hypothetical protein [Chlamydiia bacterium]MCH9629902.1 hypothetical protein [Chlamydiia bacterium]
MSLVLIADPNVHFITNRAAGEKFTKQRKWLQAEIAFQSALWGRTESDEERIWTIFQLAGAQAIQGKYGAALENVQRIWPLEDDIDLSPGKRLQIQGLFDAATFETTRS